MARGIKTTDLRELDLHKMMGLKVLRRMGGAQSEASEMPRIIDFPAGTSSQLSFSWRGAI